MKMIRRTKPDEIRWLAGSFVVLVFFGSVINVPFAVTRMRPFDAPRLANYVQYHGADVSDRGWPSSEPQGKDWPAPRYWSLESEFGYKKYYVMSSLSSDTMMEFTMHTQYHGWPLPVIELKSMVWNWDISDQNGVESSDPAPNLVLLGLILNPVIVGVPVWLLLCMLPLFARLVVRSRRAKHGHCPWCGYQIESFATCPECGSVRSALPI